MRTRATHEIVIERESAGWFLEHDLPHVRRVDRHPTDVGEIDFGPAVLCLRGIVAGKTEALVTELRLRHTNTVRVPRRKSDSVRESDVQRVQVRALAAQVLRFEH